MNIKIFLLAILCVFYQSRAFASDHNIFSESNSETTPQQILETIPSPSQFDPNPSPQSKIKLTFQNICLGILTIQQSVISATEDQQNSVSSSNSSTQPDLSTSNMENTNDLSYRLTQLIMENKNSTDDKITKVGTQLCKLLKDNPQFEPIIKRCAEIQAGMVDQDSFNIEKYETPSSITNLINIGLGIILDVGQITSTYITSRWLGCGIIAISLADGAVTGLKTWLEAKTQSIINYYSNNMQGQQAFDINSENKEVLNSFSESIIESYSELVRYIDSNNLLEIKETQTFTDISKLISKIQSVKSRGNTVKFATKILSVLGSTTAGIINIIYGADTLQTSIAISASLGCSALYNRIAESNYHAAAARQSINLAYIYGKMWDLIDLIQTAEGEEEEPSEYQQA